jgi:hypothetical protein
VRIFLVLGFAVLGLALVILWREDHTTAPPGPAAPPGSPLFGRSTLSHGGPAAGSLPDAQRRPALLGRNASSDQSQDFPGR